MLAATLALACVAVDGDTLRCGPDRVRLLGIDAPETPGHCRTGRTCAPGDPFASKRHLSQLVDGQPVSIQIVGKDRYGRMLAVASVQGRDLSCGQLRAGHAVYVAKWDNGRRIAMICRLD